MKRRRRQGAGDSTEAINRGDEEGHATQGAGLEAAAEAGFREHAQVAPCGQATAASGRPPRRPGAWPGPEPSRGRMGRPGREPGHPARQGGKATHRARRHGLRGETRRGWQRGPATKRDDPVSALALPDPLVRKAAGCQTNTEPAAESRTASRRHPACSPSGCRCAPQVPTPPGTSIDAGRGGVSMMQGEQLPWGDSSASRGALPALAGSVIHPSRRKVSASIFL